MNRQDGGEWGSGAWMAGDVGILFRKYQARAVLEDRDTCLDAFSMCALFWIMGKEGYIQINSMVIKDCSSSGH
jgi:hypothetical protein